MSIDLDTTEYISIIDLIQSPYLIYPENDMRSKKSVAYLILQKKSFEILIVNPFGFNFDAVISGIDLKNIEIIAKKSPKEYKQIILKSLKNKKILEDMEKIAKSIDEDLVNNSTQNQARVKNVIRYIKDNLPAFQF